MARTESRTKTAIWRDTDFTTLTAGAQRIFWMLYSQSTISLCGVQALTVPRWAALAGDTSEADIEKALDELEGARFIVVDSQTQEVLVRTFLVHDGVWKSPKTRAAALGQLDHVLSQAIRSSIEAELVKLEGTEQADTPAGGVADTPSGGVADTPAGGVADGPRVRAGAVSDSSLLSPSPASDSDSKDQARRARAELDAFRVGRRV